MVLDFNMSKNWIDEAVEFEMNNLDTFPFSRLPNNLQLEIIEELDVRVKMELLKVNSGFRGYFARNGPLGQHLDLIQDITGPFPRWAAHRTAGHRPLLLPKLKLKRKKILLRKIRSCGKFLIKYSHVFLKDIDGKITNSMADCFRNLRVVSELRSLRLETPLHRKILTALQFEVTDWAELNLNRGPLTDFSEVADFLKGYLENQLKNCKKVAIIGGWKLQLEEAEKVLGEIPGFQLEEDPKKVEEMLEALYTNGTDKTSIVSDFLEVKCFRRKISNSEQGFVLVALTKTGYWARDDYCENSYEAYRFHNFSEFSDVYCLDTDDYYDYSDYDDYSKYYEQLDRRTYRKKL